MACQLIFKSLSECYEDRPPIEQISEVILYVEDMERMTEFYTETFGLEIASGAPEHGFVAFDTGRCQLCLHAGRDGEIGPYAPKVVFGVDDLDAVRTELGAKGVELGEVRAPTPDARVCDGTDPEGTKFSIEASD